MTSRRFWIVLLLSMGLVGLELLWTRIFAAEFFYTFAFLILSLAVLGLGVGALLNRLSERLRDRWRPEALLFLAAFAALVGPPLILRLGLEFGILFRSPKQVLLLLLALLILSLPYVAGGAALARIFRERSAEMPRLYMADLSGAGMGVGLAVLLMNGIGVPAGAVLVTVPLALSAWFAAGRFRLVYVALWGLIAVTGVFSGPLLQIPRRELGPVIHERWDALGRVKVQRMSPEYWNLNIDNVANSPVLRFDGDYKGERAKQARFLFEVKTLMEGRGRFTVASLGAGGGTEVYQALLAGAAEVHAVEVNPAINDMLVNGFLSEFTGRIYSDPRVRVVSEDGRAYLRRFRDHFDVIISSSSNTFAAMASGSFALCEDYLFTTEAFADYYRALAPGGLLLMEHQFYIPRAASEALDALTDLGVEDPMSHLAVYELPQRRRKILVMRKGALDGEILNRIVEPLTPENFDQLRLLYPPQEGTGGNLVERILTEG